MLIHPEDTIVTDEDYEILDHIISNYIEEFLETKNVKDEESLSDNETMELIMKIDEIKTEYFGEVSVEDLPEPRSGLNFTGVIFTTSDSKTLGIAHGHASLSVSADGYTHIEANPGQVSKYYYNRMALYWNKVQYVAQKVRGKSQSVHNTVASKAYNYRGYPYSLSNTGGGHNCATLVNTIWKAEGGLRYRGILAPAALSQHPDLYVIKSTYR